MVGRDDQITDFERRLDDDRRAVVIAGPSGCGKTRLVGTMAEVATRRGSEVVVVRGGQSTASVAFAPFLPLIPPEAGVELDEGQLFRLILRSARRLDRGVVVVDDAHQLDAPSATVTAALAAEADCQLVVAVRTGETPPEAISSLWKDGIVDRVELPLLDRDDVAAIVAEVLGGRIQPAVVSEIWRLSKGLPLYVNEILQASIERGVLVEQGDQWVLDGSLELSATLNELVGGRLERLDDSQLDALHLLARHTTLGRGLLEQAVGRDALAGLERRRLVTARRSDRRDDVQIGHPVYGEVLRRRLAPERRRAAHLRLADLVEEHGARRRTDSLTVVESRLAAGQEVSADRLLAAGWEAISLTDHAVAERLASYPALSADPRGLEMRGYALSGQRRFEEADDAFAEALRLLPPGDGSARIRSALASVALEMRADLLRADHLLVEAAEEATGPAAIAEVALQRATMAHVTGRARREVELLDSVDPEHLRPSDRVRLAMLQGSACSIGGRFDDAIAWMDEVRSLAAEMGTAGWMNLERAALMEVVARGHRDPVDAIARGWAHVAAAAELGEECTAPPLLGIAAVAMVAGRLDLATEANTRVHRAAVAGSDRMCDAAHLAIAGVLAVEREDWASVEWALAESRRIPFEQNTSPLLAIAAGRAMHARGEVERGIAHLVAGMDRSLERGLGHFSGQIASHVLVVGAVDEAVRGLDAVLAVTDPHWVGVRWRDTAVAVRARDIERLDSLAVGLERDGFLLDAMRAMALAARITDDPLDRLRRRLWAERVRGLTGGASCPIIRSVPATVSDRELEVLLAVVDGETNREVAERLVLSQRTVENHLHRAFTKLGSDRDTVRAVLGGAEWFAATG